MFLLLKYKKNLTKKKVTIFLKTIEKSNIFLNEMNTEFESYTSSDQLTNETSYLSADNRASFMTTTGEEVLYDLLFHDSLKAQYSPSHKVTDFEFKQSNKNMWP